MVDSLLTRIDAIPYDDLHAMLLNHEFLYGSSLKKLSLSESSATKTSPNANSVQRSTTSSASGSPQPNRGGRCFCGRVRGGRGHGTFSSGPPGQSSGRYVLIYVDDILVTNSDASAVPVLLRQLSTEFSIKDLGPLHFFLGIEAKSKIQIQGVALHDNPTEYRSMVGALQYVTLTLSDVAFSINRAYQYMHAPTKNHWQVVKRILLYLKSTSSHGLLLERSPSRRLQTVSDADWAGDGSDRKSTGGFAIFLGPNLISWKLRKQCTVACSSTEPEYKALADASVELIWLESLFKELGLPLPSPPVLWCDNIGATYLSANPMFHARTKHVEVDCHFVCDRVAKKQLQVQFIPTHDQLADTFTKALSTARFDFLRDKLKIR
ncbi:uncharacterized mitochondrial protein AtMg00810-like [Telopea speciosissima]|uniref:uncharacterized mitochondrial protein AtMg00810-like n=1 Tax=Telopea speciosissima TaxID=54955 RepID=UPI001CC3FE32|nr:uncharacterized mitochondrial protein AtMg00810-like [Telopea speciosissima]